MNYKRIFESLPVEERDAHKVYLAKAAKEEKLRIPRMKMEAKFRGLERKAYAMADILENFLGEEVYVDRENNDADVYQADSAYVTLSTADDGTIATIRPNIEPKINTDALADILRAKYDANCWEDDNVLVFRFTGDRSRLGPIMGKLKKAGLDVSYDSSSDTLNAQGFITHFLRLSLTSIEDIEAFNNVFGGEGHQAIQDLSM